MARTARGGREAEEDPRAEHSARDLDAGVRPSANAERGSPDLSPRARQIAAAALELLERDGLDALSMRNVAACLGIRAPSIYKHFPSKEALVAALISIGFREQAILFEAALLGSDEPLIAMAAAYRDYAKHHPHLYRLMYDRSLNRSLLDRGSEEAAVSPAVRAAGGDRDLARAAWAFAHGMTVLELNRRFPPDAELDVAWQRGLTALQASIGTIGASGPAGSGSPPTKARRRRPLG